MARPSSSGARSEPVRILHLTDTHLFASADGRLRDVDTRASLAAVMDDISARHWPAELVLATGDISHDEPAAAYEQFKELLAPLELPVHCIPGNHDLREIMRPLLSEAPFSYCRSRSVGNWLIVGIDSCTTGEASGRIDQAELDRMAAELAAANDPHALVCLHHPPLPMQSRWLDRVGLENADAFLDVVANAGNVRSVIFGHVHQVFDEQFGAIRVLGTPSTCAQFLPRSETFATDDRPPAYRRLSLYPDGSLQTELFWVGGDE